MLPADSTLKNNAIAISSLSDNERNAITKLLGRVKKRYDKPMQSSRNAKSRYMIPSYLQENINTDARQKASSRTRTVSWMCVPYFVLDNYSTSKPPRPSSHPMRTLLQARFSLVQKERDMQQAVRLLPNAPVVETCFHIAQVWFVVLDDCGFIPASLFCGAMLMPAKHCSSPVRGCPCLLCREI